MAVYYFFSDFEEGFTAEVTADLQKDLKKAGSIAFIASDPVNGTVTEKYAGIYLEWFKKAGIVMKDYRVLDNRIGKIEMQKSIRNADAVFLMGGMTTVQYRFLKENELDISLRNYQGCVLGLSAGAINMGRISICTKSAGHEKTEIYKGLDLMDISVEPHFEYSDRTAILEELRDISENTDIYAMCDKSAIVCRDSEPWHFYGDIYRVNRGSISKITA